jgi:hypothetical protein
MFAPAWNSNGMSTPITALLCPNAAAAVSSVTQLKVAKTRFFMMDLLSPSYGGPVEASLTPFRLVGSAWLPIASPPCIGFYKGTCGAKPTAGLDGCVTHCKK